MRVGRDLPGALDEDRKDKGEEKAHTRASEREREREREREYPIRCMEIMQDNPKTDCHGDDSA